MAGAESDGAPDAGAAEAIIFPVGQFVGMRNNGAGSYRQIRVGPEVHDLDDAMFQVWTVAHGSPHALANDVPWRRAALAEVIKAAGVGGVDGIVDVMTDKGLLVEVVPGAESAIGFAKRHRLVPLMHGLGNTVERPDLYGVGSPGRPMLQVDFVTYDLWLWSAMDETLWATCESAADVARRSGAAGRSHLTAEKLLTDFLPALRPLLMVRGACLDVPFRLSHPVQG